jgi:hypothetical protein
MAEFNGKSSIVLVIPSLSVEAQGVTITYGTCLEEA